MQEFDSPHKLLGDPVGLLSELTRSTDKETRSHLMKMVRDAHSRRGSKE